MTDATERLVASLVARAGPVRRLHRPAVRLALYLGFAALVVVLLVLLRGTRTDLAEQADNPAYLAAVLGGGLTGVTGALAALMLAVPDRSRRWILLPVPPLAIWLAAVGQECLTAWQAILPGMVTAGEIANCLTTALLAGTALSLGLIWLVRRASPLRPLLPMVAAGVAAAGLTAAVVAVLHSIVPSAMILAWNGGILVVFVAAHLLTVPRTAWGIDTVR